MNNYALVSLYNKKLARILFEFTEADYTILNEIEIKQILEILKVRNKQLHNKLNILVV